MFSNSTGVRAIVEDTFWFIFPVQQLGELLKYKDQLAGCISEMTTLMEEYLTVTDGSITSKFQFNGEVSIDKLCSREFPRYPGWIANIDPSLSEYFSSLSELPVDNRAFLYYNVNQTFSKLSHVHFGTNDQALAYMLKFKYS
jgi:hypothetical protein